MIRVSDVRKSFRSGEEIIQAVRGVSFEVPAAACMFIVGPSGSGKSTLLYMLGRSTTRPQGRSLLTVRTCQP